MPPPRQPDPAAHLADLIRLALARVAAGDDLGAVLRDLALEAFERGQRAQAPWGDEDTPVVDVHAREHPSSRPTVRPPLPRGVKRR